MSEIDEFLAKLDSDRTPVRDGNNSERIQKLTMSTRDNQGTISILVFQDKKTGGFYLKVPNVWEVYTYAKKMDDFKWCRVLEKNFYGTLTEEDSKLYDEVLGFVNSLDATGKCGYDGDNVLRRRQYSLFYGVPIVKSGANEEKDKKTLNKPTLLIFPSASTVDALADGIKTKVTAMKGNKNWIPDVFNNKPTGRKALLSISFKKGNIGYDSGVSFEFNTEYGNVVDPTFALSEEQLNMFSDMLGDFLGWNRGKNNEYFDREYFLGLREELPKMLKKYTSSDEENKDESKDESPTQTATQKDKPEEKKESADPAIPQIDPATGLPIID